MSVSLSSSDLESIRQLLKIVSDNRLSELTLSLRDGVSITIQAGPTEDSTVVPQYALAPMPQRPAPEVAPQLLSAPKAHKGIAVESPMVGIYYQSPAPGEPPFVRVGDMVRVGQTIGLIEAMKVFSEIPSEVSGRVTDVLVDNGVLVQLNQPLMYLEPA